LNNELNEAINGMNTLKQQLNDKCQQLEELTNIIDSRNKNITQLLVQKKLKMKNS